MNDVMVKSGFVIFLLLILSFSAHADDLSGDISEDNFIASLWNYFTDGANITAGIGGRTVSIDVTREGTNDRGKIAENKEDELFLLYSTKAIYLPDSNVGFSWILNLSTIHLNEQELSNEDTVNLGTEVKGYFATAVPAIFYNIGDRYRGHCIRAGIGFGIGIARFDGDVVLTESAQPNDRVNISNGTSNVFLAPGVFIDYQWENFALRLSSAGPNLVFEGYDINVSESSIVLGYTYYLK